MSKEITDSNQLWLDSPQSVLERTLIAEFLFCQGYLVSGLVELPPQTAKKLMEEAGHFAELRMAEIEFKDIVQRKVRFRISLN